MIAPRTIADALAPIRVYQRALNSVYNEAIVDLVGCPVCGVKAGEYCHGVYKLEHLSPHTSRRDLVREWRRKHPQAWAELKNDLFRRILQRQRAEQGE